MAHSKSRKITIIYRELNVCRALGEGLGTHERFDPQDNSMQTLLFPQFKSKELKHREVKELT